MADKRSPFRGANRLCGLKIDILLYTDDRASHYSRAADASGYTQDDYYLCYAPPYQGHYRQQ